MSLKRQHEIRLNQIGEAPPAPTNFTLRVDTTLGDGDLSINLLLVECVGDIDWGDGVVENNTAVGTLLFSHTYASHGIYNITFPDAIEKIRANASSTDNLKIIYIDLGTNYGAGSTDQENAFQGCSNVASMGQGTGDFSLVTKFKIGFNDCETTNFPPNVFDTCPATDYRFCFSNMNLDQQSVDNILISINTARKAGIQVAGDVKRVSINNGTSASPSASGQIEADELIADGWTVDLN